MSNRFANRMLSKAKRYIILNPDLSREQMVAMLRKRGEGKVMIEHVLKYMENTND